MPDLEADPLMNTTSRHLMLVFGVMLVAATACAPNGTPNETKLLELYKQVQDIPADLQTALVLGVHHLSPEPHDMHCPADAWTPVADHLPYLSDLDCTPWCPGKVSESLRWVAALRGAKIPGARSIAPSPPDDLLPGINPCPSGL